MIILTTHSYSGMDKQPAKNITSSEREFYLVREWAKYN